MCDIAAALDVTITERLSLRGPDAADPNTPGRWALVSAALEPGVSQSQVEPVGNAPPIHRHM